MESSSDDEHVILVFKNPDSIETETEEEEILVSTTDILNWDLQTILRFPTLKIRALRSRLIQQCSYFRGLFRGSFSESCLGSTIVEWNVLSFLDILKYLYGFPLEITSDNFLSLYEGALYFGVDSLLSKCKIWLSDVSSSKGSQPVQMQMEDIILIWKFGLEHESDFMMELCTSYLARNFMWAIHSTLFENIPYNMLLSSIEHPHLTVDSEMHLSDALLRWLECNSKNMETLGRKEYNCYRMLKKIRVGLLPLWFAAGKRNSSFFRQLAEESLDSIFRQLNIPPIGSQNRLGYDDLEHLRIRLTEYSKRVNLSGCPQITHAILLLSLLPLSPPMDLRSRNIIELLYNNFEHPIGDKRALPQIMLPTLSFEGVQEVDISKCQRLLMEDAIECFCKSFSSLRTLRAAYLLNIRTTTFLKLVLKCPQVCEIDLTVDITPLMPALVSILSSSLSVTSLVSERASSVTYNAVDAFSFYESGPPLSKITKLILEGRTDIYDSDLQYISKICLSLHHLNIKGCVSVTDTGISDLIGKCIKLSSIVVCDTSFGENSVQALSSAISDCGSFSSQHFRDKHLSSVASNLQTLHMGGCRGINKLSLLKLMSQMQLLRDLCLRGTDMVDQALNNFPGSSLEILDVSDTRISGAALARIICGNPNLKCLKVRGCSNLFQEESCTEERESIFSCLHEELCTKLGKMCRLEEVEFGWGFSSLSLKAMEPALMMLQRINVGLGGMLGEDALKKLPAICPLLETIIFQFQVISDSVLVNIATSLTNLQELALCYCFGDLSISSFKFFTRNLRKLRLKRVTPWMTNDDLDVLTQNCRNLVELSLLGCPLLNSADSQRIISRGWPGLISIHLEECGGITANGISSLFDCKAIEDLQLRHNGPGLQENFIFYAASKLPMLRMLSLDICDASKGDFDIPKILDLSEIHREMPQTHADRYFLSSLKIARCKYQRCAFNLPAPSRGACSRSVHVETLVFVWNSRDLTRAVVKERL
ncbi:BTB/POZ domain-containing protein FBL11 isoform X2 [Neltuma alba]|uniref:BTB/POZ domain-containing protein FBL11 isoform X2 n=1 Tax=Neltuma alba TaxID=207710 RepID=UPI0010A495CC|nr:BTB/POZ domain-containing protein FBL11 isoform X2 [Prosopis alba]